MRLTIERRIRDNIHGTIDTTHIEDRVMEHPYFQRLRRIRQTAFLSYVFPGATHTRFEHSLGVLHLADQTWKQVARNQERIQNSVAKTKNFSLVERQSSDGIVHGLLSPSFEAVQHIFESDYNLQVFRLAAMLHDIGHSSFSHSGERFLPSLPAILQENTLSKYLRENLEEELRKQTSRGIDPYKESVRHEVFSLIAIDKILVDQGLDKEIDPRDVLSVVSPSLAPSKNSSLSGHKAYKLLHGLMSGELDIDRMDYLMRDARECGVVYGMFDSTRILDSIAVYYNSDLDEFHPAILYSGLAAFEDYLRARHSMYLQLYFHKTSVACEAMFNYIGDQLDGVRFPAAASDYFKLDEYNILGFFEDEIARSNVSVDKKYVQATLVNLLQNRVLWKRVVEIADGKPVNQGSIDRADKYLAEHNLYSNIISTSNTLTRLKDRAVDEKSQNLFRIIKKDRAQVQRVIPVEDCSDLMKQKESIYITRVYLDIKSTENFEQHRKNLIAIFDSSKT